MTTSPAEAERSVAQMNEINRERRHIRILDAIIAFFAGLISAVALLALL